MKYRLAFVALSAITPALFAQAPSPAAAADPNKVILTIGPEKITEAEYDRIVESFPPQFQQAAHGAGKRAFVEQLIQLKLLAAQGEKEKLDQVPRTKQQLEFSRENILAQAVFLELQGKIQVDDATIQKYYDAHKTDYETVKARHILIRMKGAPMPAVAGKPELSDEEALKKAQDIRKQLVAGGDFAKLAKTESDDSGSGAQGGDLGEFKKGMMVPPFEQAAFAAKVGEITEPVKSPFGYHIIEVQSHVTKPLSEVRNEIAAKLKPDMARQSVEAIRQKADVTIDDAFFGPAPAAPPTAIK